MAEPETLAKFFAQHGMQGKEGFLDEFDGAFLLIRYRGSPPQVMFVPRKVDANLTIGAEEDEVDLDYNDPTMDPFHALITFHKGFRGWTIEDQATSFGTYVDGDRIMKSKPTLLRDKVIIKPGGGLVEMQFYLAETLFERIASAGITKSLRKKGIKPSPVREAQPADDEPPTQKYDPHHPGERPTRKVEPQEEDEDQGPTRSAGPDLAAGLDL